MKVLGDGSVELTGLAPADRAKSGDLTFAEKETYFAAARPASRDRRQNRSLIAGRQNDPARWIPLPKCRVIRHNPREARIARLFSSARKPASLRPFHHLIL